MFRSTWCAQRHVLASHALVIGIHAIQSCPIKVWLESHAVPVTRGLHSPLPSSTILTASQSLRVRPLHTWNLWRYPSLSIVPFWGGTRITKLPKSQAITCIEDCPSEMDMHATWDNTHSEAHQPYVHISAPITPLNGSGLLNCSLAPHLKRGDNIDNVERCLTHIHLRWGQVVTFTHFSGSQQVIGIGMEIVGGRLILIKTNEGRHLHNPLATWTCIIHWQPELARSEANAVFISKIMVLARQFPNHEGT
jgi:hypothetical protein